MNGNDFHRGGTEGTENGKAMGKAAAFFVHPMSSAFLRALRALRASAVNPRRSSFERRN